MAFVLCLSMSNGYVMHAEGQPEMVEVSESCYKNWQRINNDVGFLAFYFEHVFINIMGKNGRPGDKPSDILRHFRDKSDIDEATKLGYMPATLYLHTFITDEKYAELDAAFAEKYKETQNIPSTWNWFNDHFREKVLREPIGNYCKEMLERDAARIALEKQGITFADRGRTMVMDGDRMSEKVEDMEVVRDALGKLYKK